MSNIVHLSATPESFPLMRPFAISRGVRYTAEIVTVTLVVNEATGYGECVPYSRYGETIDQVCAQIESIKPELMPLIASITVNNTSKTTIIEQHAQIRTQLQTVLPAGAARNGLDTALWDLAAKQTKERVWMLAGLAPPPPLQTALTISLDTSEAMAKNASQHANWPILKLKLTGKGDLERIAAVAQAAPKAKLIVDANESWKITDWQNLLPSLQALGVIMIEQPFPAHEDQILAQLDRPIMVCADESFHTSTDITKIRDCYDMINVKLDKAGGLTEALTAVSVGHSAGLKVMVGCMLGSSLAMAPAILAACQADLVDLDGPLLLSHDRNPPLHYSKTGLISAPEVTLWG